MRFEIETNLMMISAQTPQPSSALVSFAWPCGTIGSAMDEAVAADYFLGARGYNRNQLEDPSPYDFMNLKSFNTHADSPAPPADLKTVVDAAIAQGKWFNMVLNVTNNDNGAIAYAVGKDIWVGSGAAVGKYILQRDRLIITNY